MSPDTPSTLADHLDAFDSAWQQPVPPRLEDFLPPRSGPGFREVLVGLACIDLERRTKAGQPARVEDYLNRFPELREGSALLELVLVERDLRWRHDPDCNVEEYPARFPELSSQLDGSLLTVDLAPTLPGNARPSAGGGSELDLRDHVLLDLVGRGGMGEVYRGRDPALGRNLAVKVLRPELCGHPEAERRFQQEARINGLLQHPSVVPVHNLGRMTDGRLYFTMKLIRGRTLADILDQRSRIRQNAGEADPRSGECGYDLPELLGIFEKVCQALAYAHSRKVIHRDVKPANVMVGAFGEVQVMDWGLAKILPSRVALAPGEQRPAAESTMGVVFATKPEGSTAAEYGSTGVVGTPAYMAPEQARGAGEDVDERADVFGLGGILCAILTGQPPYTGQGRDEVVRQAAAGDLVDAFSRLEASGADSELVQLTRACLTAEKEARPRDAGAVAQRVTAYLAGVQQRLRAAEVERAAAQARAEEAAKQVAAERRARRLLLGLAAAVLLVLVGGIAGTTWGLLRAEKAWHAEQEQRQIAQEKQGEAESFAQTAAAEKDKAQKAEAATLADYRANTDEAIEQLIGSKTVLGPQEKNYLEKTLKRWQTFAARTGDDARSRALRAEGESRVAYMRAKLGQTQEALAGYREALALREKLVGEFPAVPAYREGLAHSHVALGVLLEGQNQGEKAVEHFHKALVIDQQLADEFPALPDYRKDLARIHNNLGLLLVGMNQWKKAAEHYHKALAIRQQLADDFPAVPEYRKLLALTHHNLGNLLASELQGTSAEEEYRKALGIQQKLADEFPAAPDYRKDLAFTHNSLGKLLAAQNQGAKAAKQYRKAVDIQQKLADDFPAIPGYRKELSHTHSMLGILLAGQRQPDKAAEQFHKALAIVQKLADEFSTVPDYHKDLALIDHHLGFLLAGQNQREKAAEYYHKALDLQQKLADEFPAVPTYRQDLANTHNSLAALLEVQGQKEKASEHYRKALDIRQKLADEFPAQLGYQVDLAGSCCNYGDMLRLGGKLADSLPWYDKAIRTLTRVHQQDPRVVTPRLFLRNSHGNRALAYDQLQKHAEAVKDWTRAIELSPRQQQPSLRLRRANSRVRAGQMAEAVAEVAELARVGNPPAAAWYNFARIYAVASGKSADKKQEYAGRAMELLDKAVVAGFKNAEHMMKDKDLDALRQRDDFKKLLASLAKPKEKKAAGPEK